MLHIMWHIGSIMWLFLLFADVMAPLVEMCALHKFCKFPHQRLLISQPKQNFNTYHNVTNFVHTHLTKIMMFLLWKKVVIPRTRFISRDSKTNWHPNTGCYTVGAKTSRVSLHGSSPSYRNLWYLYSLVPVTVPVRLEISRDPYIGLVSSGKLVQVQYSFVEVMYGPTFVLGCECTVSTWWAGMRLPYKHRFAARIIAIRNLAVIKQHTS